MNNSYFDLQHFVPDWQGQTCPVRNCTASLDAAPSRWGWMPYCPVHALRIHTGSRTFVYYNGAERNDKRTAALRNIRFHAAYFAAHILHNSFKAETARISHETSEDALTWNVFSEMASNQRLSQVVAALTGRRIETEPELYLWGLKVALDNGSSEFQPLLRAREVFEPDIQRFMTEPDVILYVPGQLIVVIEAKFTSGNPLANTDSTKDHEGKKPDSIQGLLARYEPARLTSVELNVAGASLPFFAQLYRNLVFAIHMAEQLNVQWYVVNLVSKHQFADNCSQEFADPRHFFRSILPSEFEGRFRFESWESLYETCVKDGRELTSLKEYLTRKTAYARKALGL
jgi:hypothetical protein